VLDPDELLSVPDSRPDVVEVSGSAVVAGITVSFEVAELDAGGPLLNPPEPEPFESPIAGPQAIPSASGNK